MFITMDDLQNVFDRAIQDGTVLGAVVMAKNQSGQYKNACIDLTQSTESE